MEKFSNWSDTQNWRVNDTTVNPIIICFREGLDIFRLKENEYSVLV